MGQSYSLRNRPQPTQLRYDLPDHVRKRIFRTLEQTGSQDDQFDLRQVLSELGNKLSAKYGYLHRPAYDAAIQSENPVIEHFLSCNEAKALDYIEFWLRCPSYRFSGPKAVDAINDVLREEGIGYELSPWIQKEIPRPQTIAAIIGLVGTQPEVVAYPEIIRKDSQFTHANIVQPCHDVLANPEFAQANKEMLDAFAKHRLGDFDGALTSCGAAFESVFKTICTHKNWPYDPDKDTLSKLVDICNACSGPRFLDHLIS